jgi:hypothetical protein
MLKTDDNSDGTAKTQAPANPAQLRQAELRLAHAGRWVAWYPDDSSIAAVADSREAIQEMVRSLGIEGLAIELVPPANYR